MSTRVSCPEPPSGGCGEREKEGLGITPGGSVQSTDIPRQVLIRNNYKVRNRSTSDVIHFDYIIDNHSYIFTRTAQGT